MNAVLVTNGVVVQCDRSGNVPDGFVLTTDDVLPGYTYSNGVFSAPPIPPPAPLFCSDLQFRLALNQLGLRSAVETYVANASQDTKDWWDRATVIHADNPLLNQAATALGKTRQDIDNAISLGNTLG